MAAELAKLPSRRILIRPRRKRGSLYQGVEGRGTGVEGLDSPVPTARGTEVIEVSVRIVLGGVGVEVVVVRGRRGRSELVRKGGRGLLRRHIRGSIFEDGRQLSGFADVDEDRGMLP